MMDRIGWPRALSASAFALLFGVSGCTENKAGADSTPGIPSPYPPGAALKPAEPVPAEAPQRGYQAAPDFTLENLAGGTLQLSSLRGKVVLIDFWATWCGPCRTAIPHLNSLYAAHKAQGLEVIGVSVDRGRGNQSGADLVKEFAKQVKLDYPQVMATQATVQAYGGIQSIPTAFLIDREGFIRKRYVGLQPKHVFDAAVQELLNEPAPGEDGMI
jgi:thiol-disulfide isomerase/thioredoxin